MAAVFLLQGRHAPSTADMTGVALLRSVAVATLQGQKLYPFQGLPSSNIIGRFQPIQEAARLRLFLYLTRAALTPQQLAQNEARIRELDPAGLTAEIINQTTLLQMDDDVGDFAIRVYRDMDHLERANRAFFDLVYDLCREAIQEGLGISHQSLAAERSLFNVGLQQAFDLKQSQWSPTDPWERFQDLLDFGHPQFCLGRFAAEPTLLLPGRLGSYRTFNAPARGGSPAPSLKEKYVLPEPVLVIGWMFSGGSPKVLLFRTHIHHEEPTSYCYDYSRFCELITDLSGSPTRAPNSQYLLSP